MKEPDLDIIIPTYKPDEGTCRLFKMLERQELLPHRLIIINTEEALMPGYVKAEIERLASDSASRLFGKIELIHIKKEEFDHAATRAFAAARSKADIFVCMTDDAVPKDEKLLSYLSEAVMKVSADGKRVAAAYARQLPKEGCGPIESFVRSFNYPENGCIKTKADIKELGIKTYFASDVCCAYDKKIFEKLGGFVESAVFNEDMIYAHKAIHAGYAICYEARAMVYHSHEYGLTEFLRRNFDMGMSQAMHKEVFSDVSSEGEGLKLVRDTMKYLIAEGKPFFIPRFIAECAFKYAGYLLGKNYARLPKALALQLSSNKGYIEKVYGGMKP